LQSYGRNGFPGLQAPSALKAKGLRCRIAEPEHDSLAEASDHRLPHDRDDVWWRRLLNAASLPYPDSARHLAFHRCGLPIEAAAQGPGVAVGDNISAETHLADGRLLRVPGPVLEGRDDYLLVKRSQAADPLPRAVAWLKSEAQAFEERGQECETRLTFATL